MLNLLFLHRYGARMVGGDLIIAAYKQEYDISLKRSEGKNTSLPSESCMCQFTRPEDSLSVMHNNTTPSPLRDIVSAAAEVVGGLCGSLQTPAPASWLVGGSASAPLSSPHTLHLSPGKLSPC